MLQTPNLLNEKNMESTLVVQRQHVAASRYLYLFFKRIFDIFVSCVALIILSPLLLIVSILIKAEDGGPIIHTRICVREKGTYKMYKFRSMLINSQNLENYFTSEQVERFKKEQKIENDPRITKVGAFIRKWSVDELPQLITILKGDMSIVGPRPLVATELENYGDKKNEILSVKPGLTGYWQVNGRSNVTYETGERQNMELFYVHNCSISLDIKILIKTILVVLKKEGAQ